jgi:undecaprenyl-phosphate 4-deoxy-4-formamido-L-arabinose transferase
MKISAVVPVFNSEESLPELVERLEGALALAADAYELILVNDGSPDGSWKAIEALARRHPNVRGFNLSRNFGQHNALLCGVRAARYETVVTLDDDLQNPPEELPRLLAALNEHDVVYGVPAKMQHGLFRNMASRLTKFTLRTSMGVKSAPDVSAFRVFRRDIRDAFVDFRGSYVSLDVLLTWGTTNFGSVTVAHDERKYGRSNYTLRKLVVHAINMTTGFSTLPLRLASLIGFAFTLFGIAVLIYVIGRFVLSGLQSIPGFPFLASIIAIFAGAQLFALGIIGEYLARVYTRTMERPTYAVRQSTDKLDANRVAASG